MPTPRLLLLLTALLLCSSKEILDRNWGAQPGEPAGLLGGGRGKVPPQGRGGGALWQQHWVTKGAGTPPLASSPSWIQQFPKTPPLQTKACYCSAGTPAHPVEPTPTGAPSLGGGNGFKIREEAADVRAACAVSHPALLMAWEGRPSPLLSPAPPAEMTGEGAQRQGGGPVPLADRRHVWLPPPLLVMGLRFLACPRPARPS